MDELIVQPDAPATPNPQPIGYVTYIDDGALDGCYFQVPPDEHLGRMIEVDEFTRAAWVNYRANEARDGIELAPAPVADLESLKAAAIAKTYADVDAVYDAAIGRRGTEYTEAEVAARAFVDAGYEGEASAYVSSFAASNPTGETQTDRWAAEQIIARADAFRGAQLAMRSTRFNSQTEMRAAESPEGLAAAVATWDAFIAGIRSALGV